MPIYDCSISLRDAFKRRTTRTVQIDALDYITAQATAATFIAAYDNMTDMRVLHYRVSQFVDVVSVVVAGANVDRGLTASFELVPLAGKFAAAKVPSPPINLFDDDGNLLTADARVVAWAALYLTGDVLISDGETAGDLVGGTLDK